MSDSENSKFCSTHGIALEDGNVCRKCGPRYKVNLKDGTFSSWYIENYSNVMIGYNICDNCKYYMSHYLNYCPKCGGKYRREKMLGKDFMEKYKDYKDWF